MPKFNRKNLKQSFKKASEGDIPWIELKKLDEGRILSIVGEKMDSRGWRKYKKLKELIPLVPELIEYRNYLERQVKEEKSMIQIATELGYSNAGVIHKHLDFFGIKPLSKSEAATLTHQKKGRIDKETRKSITRVVPSRKEQEERRAHAEEIFARIRENKKKQKK